MPSPDDPEVKSMIRTLTEPPFNMSFAHASAAVGNGTAAEMIAAAREHEAAEKAKLDDELRTLKDGAKSSPTFRVPLNIPGEMEKFPAGVSDAKPPARDLVEAMGDRIKAQAEIIAAQAVKKVKPPGQAVLSGIAANPPAQSSEPQAVATGGRRLFFTCRVCLGGFVFEPGTQGVVECQCGAAKFGNDGVKPFDELGIRLQTSECLEVTELVECGKLSAVMPTPSAERFPWLVVYTVHNKTARNVSQKSPIDVTRLAADGVKAGVLPATDYIHRAALVGARVQWHSHYHTRACGVEKTADRGDFLKREATGDARFCGTVIVRDQKNEADGSLLFSPVMGCARCGEDHKAPVPFWKLTNPVWCPVPGGGSVLVATHFANCPSKGEPILMLSSEGVEPVVYENAAEADFSKPAPTGKVEQSVNSIGGSNPIDGPRPDHLSPVGGVGNSDEHQSGRAAGIGSGTIVDDPHPPGTQSSEDWRRGFIEGRSAKHG